MYLVYLNIQDRIWQRARFIFECSMLLQVFLNVQASYSSVENKDFEICVYRGNGDHQSSGSSGRDRGGEHRAAVPGLSRHLAGPQIYLVLQRAADPLWKPLGVFWKSWWRKCSIVLVLKETSSEMWHVAGELWATEINLEFFIVAELQIFFPAQVSCVCQIRFIHEKNTLLFNLLTIFPAKYSPVPS